MNFSQSTVTPGNHRILQMMLGSLALDDNRSQPAWERMRPLQEQAVRQVLKRLGLGYFPRRLQEMLDHVDAVSAVRIYFRFLGLPLEEDGSTTLNTRRREVFAVIRQAEQAAETSGLDEYAVYEAVHGQNPVAVHDALTRLELASLLQREAETPPAHFPADHARLSEETQQLLRSWEKNSLQKFRDCIAEYRRWRRESDRAEKLVAALRTSLAAVEESGPTDETQGKFDLLQRRLGDVMKPHGHARACLAELETISNVLQGLLAAQADQGRARIEAAAVPEPEPELPRWRPWSESLVPTLLLCALAICYAVAGVLSQRPAPPVELFTPLASEEAGPASGSVVGR